MRECDSRLISRGNLRACFQNKRTLLKSHVLIYELHSGQEVPIFRRYKETVQHGGRPASEPKYGDISTNQLTTKKEVKSDVSNSKSETKIWRHIFGDASGDNKRTRRQAPFPKKITVGLVGYESPSNGLQGNAMKEALCNVLS